MNFIVHNKPIKIIYCLILTFLSSQPAYFGLHKSDHGSEGVITNFVQTFYFWSNVPHSEAKLMVTLSHLLIGVVFALARVYVSKWSRSAYLKLSQLIWQQNILLVNKKKTKSNFFSFKSLDGISCMPVWIVNFCRFMPMSVAHGSECRESRKFRRNF